MEFVAIVFTEFNQKVGENGGLKRKCQGNCSHKVLTRLFQLVSLVLIESE